MLGISQHAEIAAAQFYKDTTSSSHRAALAYLQGLNEYIENGKTPVEFRLIGIKKEKFTVKDLYLIVGLHVILIFKWDFVIDPLMSRIRKNLGEKLFERSRTGICSRNTN